MKQSQRIVKNALSGVVAEVTGGLLHLVTLLLIARTVSVDEFGTFSFIAAFAGIFQLLADFGLSNILTREMTTKRDAVPALLAAAKSLIWILSGAAAGVMILVVVLLGLPPEVKALTIVMGLAALTLFHSAGYTAVFRAYEEMEYNALGYILHKLLLLALVYGGLKAGLGLWGIIPAFLIANVLLWFFYYWLIRLRYTRPRMTLNPPLWKSLLRAAVPLGGGMVLRQAAWQVDILMLTWLAGVGAVGLFSGPYRILMAFNLLPLVLALPLFPMYARLGRENPSQFREAVERGFKFFCLLSFPAATGFMILAEPLVIHLFGMKYEASVPVLQLLSIALVPLFASTLFPFVFTAIGLQRLFLWTVGAGLTLRILLNLILIPFFGYLGACLSVVLSETAVLGMGIVALRQSGNPLRLGRILWRPMVGSLVMGIVLYLTQGLPIAWGVAGIGLAGLLYLGVLFGLKTFSDEEVRLAREGLSFLKPLMTQKIGKL